MSALHWIWWDSIYCFYYDPYSRLYTPLQGWSPCAVSWQPCQLTLPLRKICLQTRQFFCLAVWLPINLAPALWPVLLALHFLFWTVPRKEVVLIFIGALYWFSCLSTFLFKEILICIFCHRSFFSLSECTSYLQQSPVWFPHLFQRGYPLTTLLHWTSDLPRTVCDTGTLPE